MAAQLRVDASTWVRLARASTTAGAALVVGGTFAVLAVDRLGFPGLATPRAVVRFLLVGFYGWFGMASGLWLTARLRGLPAPFELILRLTGHAHVPVLILAVSVQVLVVGLDLQGVGRWPAAVVLGFWFPAMLSRATQVANGTALSEAVAVVVPFYFAWLASVGWWLWSRLAHLL